jgi:hypothetical protein
VTDEQEKRILGYLIVLIRTGHIPLERAAYEFAEPLVKPMG